MEGILSERSESQPWTGGIKKRATGFAINRLASRDRADESAPKGPLRTDMAESDDIVISTLLWSV